MILRTSGIGVSIVFLREAQWGSRGREFDSRHSDHKSNDFTLEIVGFFACGLTSFGFDHNFDHNANDFIWSTACRMPAVSGAEKPFCSAKSSASCSTVMPVYTLQRIGRSLPPLRWMRQWVGWVYFFAALLVNVATISVGE